MKIFKSVDVMIQLNLIVFGVIIGVLNPNYAIYSYFIVGGWQLLSCVIHGVFPGHYNSVQARKYYLLALLILILLGIMVFISNRFWNQEFLWTIFYLYLFLLLFFTPGMAIWYCYICFKELKLYQQKEWIQLR